MICSSVYLLRFIVWSFPRARLQFTLDQFKGATSLGLRRPTDKVASDLSSRPSELYSRSNNDLTYRFFDGGRPWHVGKTGSHRSIASATDGMTRASSCGPST
jgi:hypothetical protein